MVLRLRISRVCGAFFAFILAVTILFVLPARADEVVPRTFFHGVNFPQASFGKVPGQYGKDYAYQTADDVNAYADLGANIVRIAFKWEHIQPLMTMPLAADELARLDALVAAAEARRMAVLLDVHNYGAYKGFKIGSDEVPVDAFVDLWKRLAEHYKKHPRVMFGLMNEPHEHSADEWAAIAQRAISGIRATGALQTIVVPGTIWSGAHSWTKKVGAHSNAEALATLRDPAHNMVFEAHQYFDGDSSGTHPDCVSEDIGEKRLVAMTEWLRKSRNRAILGEFGASSSPVCVEALRRTLKFMGDNADVWYGWTYWAAAPWFGNYMFNVYPPDPTKIPQLGVLAAAMAGK